MICEGSGSEDVSDLNRALKIVQCSYCDKEWFRIGSDCTLPQHTREEHGSNNKETP